MVNVNDISKFDERFIVVAAEPGMGKTTALTRFGTQKANESKWIIRINLVDCKEKLEQVNFNEEDSIVTFLHGDEANTLTKKLLKSRLNQSSDEAWHLCEGIYKIQKEKLGANHSDTSSTRNLMESLRNKQKRKKDSKAITSKLSGLNLVKKIRYYMV